MNILRTTVFCLTTTFCFSTFCLSYNTSSNTTERTSIDKSGITVHTIYGSEKITEPVLVELLTSSALERTKHVRQYGVTFYARPEIKDFSRYEHNLGVFFLLRRHNASLVEQIAGLLHDVSHTVFSHVGDFLYKPKNPKYAYQDEIHAWFLEKSGVGLTLKKYGINIDDLLITTGKNKMLKTSFPSMCADNIDYILRAGILTNMLTKDEADAIIDELFYHDGNWCLRSTELAKKLARVALFHTKDIWGGPGNDLTYKWTSQALKRAISLKEITPEEINFSVDAVIWEKLCMSHDEEIKILVKRILNHKNFYTVGTKENHTDHLTNKFRGIDPCVMVNGKIRTLSELDAEFKKEFEGVKKEVKDGWYIKAASQV